MAALSGPSTSSSTSSSTSKGTLNDNELRWALDLKKEGKYTLSQIAQIVGAISASHLDLLIKNYQHRATKKEKEKEKQKETEKGKENESENKGRSTPSPDEWLRKLGLEEYIEKFKKHKFTSMYKMACINDEVLDSLEIKELSDRILLKRASALIQLPRVQL